MNDKDFNAYDDIKFQLNDYLGHGYTIHFDTDRYDRHLIIAVENQHTKNIVELIVDSHRGPKYVQKILSFDGNKNKIKRLLVQQRKAKNIRLPIR